MSRDTAYTLDCMDFHPKGIHRLLALYRGYFNWQDIYIYVVNYNGEYSYELNCRKVLYFASVIRPLTAPTSSDKNFSTLARSALLYVLMSLSYISIPPHRDT